MGGYLSGGHERLVGTETRYGRENPRFQPQWWHDKHYQPTFSNIPVFTQCKYITWKDEVQCGSISCERRLPEHLA